MNHMMSFSFIYFYRLLSVSIHLLFLIVCRVLGEGESCHSCTGTHCKCLASKWVQFFGSLFRFHCLSWRQREQERKKDIKWKMDNEQPISDTKRNVWNIWNGFLFFDNLEWLCVHYIHQRYDYNCLRIHSVNHSPNNNTKNTNNNNNLSYFVNTHSASKMNFECRQLWMVTD